MEQFITSKGIPVHISDSEKGEKILFLLHGYLETLYIWELFEEELKKRNIRVITMDIPGHGLSGYKEGMDFSFIAEVIDGVLDNRGINRCFLGGHSMGGYIIQEYLRMFPNKVEGLILFNSSPFADNPDKKEERFREIKVIEEGKFLVLAGMSLPKIFAKENLRKWDEFILEAVGNCETHDPRGIVAGINAMMGRADQTALLAGTKTPILFIMGDNDTYFPMEIVEKMRETIPSAKFVILPGTGHISFIEEIEQCAQIVEKFIEN